MVLGTDENETADRIWLHVWWLCWFCTDARRPRKGWVVLGTDENETADRIWLHVWWLWFCTDARRPSGRTTQVLPLRAKDERAQKLLLPPLPKLLTAIMAEVSQA